MIHGFSKNNTLKYIYMVDTPYGGAKFQCTTFKRGANVECAVVKGGQILSARDFRIFTGPPYPLIMTAPLE